MTNFGGVSGTQLKQYIERIENLEEQKNAVTEDFRSVFAEAKSMGFDVKIIREILRIRKIDTQVREEHEELLQVYLQALSMALHGTSAPVDQAA